MLRSPPLQARPEKTGGKGKAVTYTTNQPSHFNEVGRTDLAHSVWCILTKIAGPRMRIGLSRWPTLGQGRGQSRCNQLSCCFSPNKWQQPASTPPLSVGTSEQTTDTPFQNGLSSKLVRNQMKPFLGCTWRGWQFKAPLKKNPILPHKLGMLGNRQLWHLVCYIDFLIYWAAIMWTLGSYKHFFYTVLSDQNP